MKILGLIPARGGSKGVPRKNIKMLCGKPLLAYSIETALKSECFDEIMVSTDDSEIANIALKLGASVPFMRPSTLADDLSPTVDTVLHVLEEYQKMDKIFDAVCILQPTNPLRTIEMISLSVNKFRSSKTDSLISVREVPHTFNPYWIFEDKDDCGLLSPVSRGHNNIISRRQDLPKVFYRDGSIYITKASVISNLRSLYGASISYINFEHESHINIDTMDDWKLAEKMLCVE